MSSNSEQLQQEEEEKVREEEEGEREEEKEGSREELPPSPPTPQLLIEALTASLKKVCQVDPCRLFPRTMHFLLFNMKYMEWALLGEKVFKISMTSNIN